MAERFKLCAFADEAGDSLNEQISALRDNEISLIELRNTDSKSILDYDKEYVKETRKRLDDSGIKVWSLGSPIGKININDDFAPHLEKFKKAVEYADILGTQNIRIFSFFIDDENDCEKYKDKVLSQLLEFVRVVHGSKIDLCHENEKKIYGDIATRCVDIHKNIPQIRAVFDPANFVQCGQNTLTAFEQLAPYIKYMHIKDSLENGEIVEAGKGVGNIRELLAKYKGNVLTLEPHLWQFSGLKNLEKSGDESIIGNGYKSQRQAFDSAVSALKSLL